ncbi:hypothetical protein [Thalassotalea agarivorans]|uniref:Uncharacterized protein n=1 Tax=Thalassotalea agarivorans TaxID=349064 RepID=A0A1I0HH32_THASX|nr:hypothetical protein [Thalassotalea agarivorans]SET83000.1 hypothetical protein SAMN05660429_02803 [Thalassotalea agarivorans]
MGLKKLKSLFTRAQWSVLSHLKQKALSTFYVILSVLILGVFIANSDDLLLKRKYILEFEEENCIGEVCSVDYTIENLENNVECFTIVLVDRLIGFGKGHTGDFVFIHKELTLKLSPNEKFGDSVTFTKKVNASWFEILVYAAEC